MEQLLNHPMVQSVMVWVGLGLATGVAAKILMPGSENMGWIRTILFGLLGSFIGNNIFPRNRGHREYGSCDTRQAKRRRRRR